MDIGTLLMKIKADSSQFDGVMSKVGSGVKGAAKAAAGAAVAIGAAGVAAGAGVYTMATKAADATDRIDKMSQKLGFSRNAFQEWDFITSQSGTSVESLTMGMKTLTNQFDELGKGGKVATDAFGQLGIKYENLQGMSQEEIFETTIVALQGMEDETKRAALANDLLGRSGQELAPLLNAGADSVEAMKKQAKELGLILGDDAIDAGVKFTDTVDQLKRSMGAVFATVGVQLIPIMQRFAEWIISNMPNIQRIAGSVFEFLGKIVTKASEVFEKYFLPVLKNIHTWVQSNMPSISGTASAVFGIIQNVASNVVKFFQNHLVPVFEKLATWWKDNSGIIMEIVSDVFFVIWEAAKLAWGFFEKYLLPVFLAVADFVIKQYPVVKDVMVTAFETIMKVIKPVWEFLDKHIFPIIKAIYDFVNDNFYIVGDIFEAVFTGIGKSIDKVLGTFQKLYDVFMWLPNLIADVNKAGEAAKAANEKYNQPNSMPGGFNGSPSMPSNVPTPSRGMPSGGGSSTINVNVSGNTIMNDRDVDMLGSGIVRSLKLGGVR